MRNGNLLSHILWSVAILLGFVSATNAAINDPSNKQYKMVGVAKYSFAARCGPLTRRIVQDEPPTEEFLIEFSELIVPSEAGGILGSFKITEDTLLAPGTVIEGDVIGPRKGNKLTFTYKGLTQSQSAEYVMNKIIKKLEAYGVVLAAPATVKKHTFNAFVGSNSLRFQEKMSISLPDYPKRGCNGTANLSRKLSGLVVGG